jgi:DNA mismatch repair protein MLH1
MELVPARIHQLPPDIAAKLRAGEVVGRPWNAVKEVLENALDANCSSLKIDVTGYGFKQISIADDGSGINKDDLPMVCECHATSKLQSIEDLKTIRTFGFRGEALSSISNVAHVTVISQTASSPCAYKASYHMHKMLAAPQPVAGKRGTTIIIQDLFFTVPAKRKTFTKPKDDFTDIKDVIMAYAVHNPKVCFVLKQSEAKVAEVNTPSNSTVAANIASLFGRSIAENLIPVSLNVDVASLHVEGFVTNGKHNGPKSTYVFFVNNRLVEMPSFKSAVEQAYASAFAKQGKLHPFVYLSVTVLPQNVDVNVDCAKSKVKVLHDSKAAEALGARVTELLREWEKSRTEEERQAQREQEKIKEAKAAAAKSKQQSSNVVRELVYAKKDSPAAPKSQNPICVKSWSALSERASSAAAALFKGNVFVGVVDPMHSLVSFNKTVYSVNHIKMSQLLATQYFLRQVGNALSVPVSPVLSLPDVFAVALASKRSGYDAEKDGQADVRVTEMTAFLCDKARWLSQWFGLEIDADSQRLLRVPRDPLGNVPDLTTLPLMLMSLCYDVDWGQLIDAGETDDAQVSLSLC